MPYSLEIENDAVLYLLKWKYHHSNIKLMFTLFLERECFCDVTLVCEGGTLKAHKIMLSACSNYFESLFSNHEEKYPIIILKDVKFDDFKTLLEFIYKGEVNVESSQINTFLKLAEELQVKGLASVSPRFAEESRGSGQTHHSAEGSGDQQTGTKRRKKRNFKGTLSTHGLSNAATSSNNVYSESLDSIWSHEGFYAESEDADGDCIPMNVEEDSMENTEANEHQDVPSLAGGEPQAGGEPHIPAELSNVTNMTYYIQQGGRKTQFWEISSTKRVLDAIKNKDLEMKVAANLLGVSYGTLYSRYRDSYGSLKQSYKVHEFWENPSVFEETSQVQCKELSLLEAAEMLNVNTSALKNHLGTLNDKDIADNDDQNIDNDVCQQQAPVDYSDRIVEEGMENNSSICISEDSS